MPAYSLLCQRVAHSLSFASVFYAECLTANLECRIVTGTLNGSTRDWNLLRIDGDYYYVDLMRSIELEETELQLLTQQELEEAGYLWDASAYPATPEPEDTPPEDAEPPVSSDTPIIAPSTEATEETTEPTSESTEGTTEEAT